LRSTWTASWLAAVTSEKTPPSNVRGYDWLSLNFGNMRDGGSLGKQLLPLPVWLLATGAESQQTLATTIALACDVARKRRCLGKFHIHLALNVATLLSICGDNHVRASSFAQSALDMVGGFCFGLVAFFGGMVVACGGGGKGWEGGVVRRAMCVNWRGSQK
jgi:hypothetical protein